MKKSIAVIAAAVGLVLCFLSGDAAADCAKDVRGEVYCGAGRCLADRDGTIWCSRFYNGGVAVTRDGAVVCGRGRCATDIHGRTYCSSELDGAVTIDIKGRVRCYGRCELASRALCEHTIAGSSG